MKIVTNLPFDICETCEECVLDVDEQVLFFGFDRAERVITVGCKNEKLCKRLKENMEKGDN